MAKLQDSFKKSIKDISSAIKDGTYIIYIGLSNFLKLLGQRITTELEYKNEIRKAELNAKKETKLLQAPLVGRAKAKAETSYAIAQIKQRTETKIIRLNEPKQTNQDILGISPIPLWGNEKDKKQKGVEFF